MKASSTVLVLLIAFSAIWGECATCAPFTMQSQTQPPCCARESGHCSMPSEQPKQNEKPCPNLALAPVIDHNAQSFALDVFASAPMAIEAEAPVLSIEPSFEPVIAPDTGPPELYLIHSILRV